MVFVKKTDKRTMFIKFSYIFVFKYFEININKNNEFLFHF